MCRPFLRGRSKQTSIYPSDSASTEGYRKVEVFTVSGLLWVCTREIFDTWAKRAVREYWVSTL